MKLRNISNDTPVEVEAQKIVGEAVMILRMPPPKTTASIDKTTTVRQ